MQELTIGQVSERSRPSNGSSAVAGIGGSWSHLARRSGDSDFQIADRRSSEDQAVRELPAVRGGTGPLAPPAVKLTPADTREVARRSGRGDACLGRRQCALLQRPGSDRRGGHGTDRRPCPPPAWRATSCSAEDSLSRLWVGPSGPALSARQRSGWLREKKASSKIPEFRPVSPPSAPYRFMRRTRVSKSAFGTAGLYPVSDPLNQCAWCDSSLMCQSFETKSSSLVANSNQARNSATREGCINMPFSL